MPMTTATVYAQERKHTIDRLRWLENGAALARERGDTARADVLTAAAEHVARAVDALPEAKDLPVVR